MSDLETEESSVAKPKRQPKKAAPKKEKTIRKSSNAAYTTVKRAPKEGPLKSMKGISAKKGGTMYNEALGVFIADKISQGWSMRKLHQEFPDTIPDPSTIINWKKRFPEFGAQIKEAYGIQIYNQMDEATDLSKELLVIDKELCEKLDDAKKSGDPEQMKEALVFAKIHSATLRDRRDNIRVRLDTIKFSLAKLAHIFLTEFKESPRTAVQVNVPSVSIVNYKDLEDEENK